VVAAILGVMDHNKTIPAGRAQPPALLVLADGTVLEGYGLGAAGHAAARYASTPR